MLTFVVQTEGDPAMSLVSLQGVIQEQDANVVVDRVTTLSNVVDSETASYRAVALLVGVFAFIALFLAAVGLYGVQSFVVSRRAKEIGIRMALGAVREQVAGEVLLSGLLKAALGVVVGIVGAVALGGMVQGMMFGVEARDPLTLAIVPAVLLGAAAIANLVPALRASGVDPVSVLREE